MFSDGSTLREDVTIGATSRSTVNVNDFVGPNRDVSVKITADSPIVAERPIYFNYNGAWTGGHDVIGATSRRGDLLLRRGLHRRGHLYRVPLPDEPGLHRHRGPHHLHVLRRHHLAGGRDHRGHLPVHGERQRLRRPQPRRQRQDHRRLAHRGRAPHLLQLQRRLDRRARRHRGHLAPRRPSTSPRATPARAPLPSTSA